LTYTGLALTPCTAAVTGAGGLNQSLAVSYSDNTAAGTAKASASYAGANHLDSSDWKTFTIAKAPSVTTLTCPGSVMHTGSPIQPCTAAVTGAGGLSGTPTISYSNNTFVGTATASATWSEGANHNGSSDAKTFAIAPATATCNVTGYTLFYDGVPHTATGSCTGDNGEPLAGLNLSGTTHTNVATAADPPVYNDTWTFTDSTGNYSSQTGKVSDRIYPRPVLVNYSGLTVFFTAGTTSTTAQVTLSASLQDPAPTKVNLSGAKVTFWDCTSTCKALASNVSVTAGSPGNGTATTGPITLSSGQYGSQAYMIMVTATGGNYTNQDQPPSTTMVVVSKPAATYQTTGGGNPASLSSPAGTYGSTATAPATYSLGLSYAKGGTSPKGGVTFSIPQADGSKLIVKSNSITSVSITGTSPKKAAIITKASLLRVVNGVSTLIDGNATLRVDAEDGSTDKIGLTLRSASNSLYYSNNWVSGMTQPQAIASGSRLEIK